MHTSAHSALFTIACLIITASAASAATYVSQDFEGSTFPPTGWTTYGTGNWSWVNGGGNAYGTAGANRFETANAHLQSPDFNVEAGKVLRIRFRYTSSTTGSPGSAYRWAVFSGGWSKMIMATTWTQVDELTNPVETTGSYCFKFDINVNGGAYTGGGATLRVDDVLVTDREAAVAPASLGRVKAAFGHD
jgi:hypothetical protein